MSYLVLAVYRISEVFASAIKTALISIGVDVGNGSEGPLIVVQRFKFSGVLSELYNVFWKAQQNANGIFLFFFHPTEVISSKTC